MNSRDQFTNASLFPDPSLPMRKRRYAKAEEEKEEELIAFGYELKIFNNKLEARKVAKGSYLIPWKCQLKEETLLDRYDVRHLVQDKSSFIVNEKAKLDPAYDNERYTMIIDDSNNKTKAEIPYDHNDNNNKKPKITVTEIEKEIMKKYKTPKSMIVPANMIQVNIIESVSKEIKTAKNPNLLEIRIQVKNSSNELYSFLNKRDRLYPFYQYIVKRNCLVEYSDSENSDSEYSDN